MSTTTQTILRKKAELIKPYSPKEMWSLYDVTPKTFRSWIKPFNKEIGKRMGRLYTPKQVEIIFESLGLPSGILVAEEEN